MSTISTAVGLERLSRVAGYKIKKGFFTNETPNLPQIIAVFGEANTANQSGLTVTKKEVTSAKEAAEEWGYGSPIHQQMRILRPSSGDGVGGIPTVVFPQLTAGGATATLRTYKIRPAGGYARTHCGCYVCRPCVPARRRSCPLCPPCGVWSLLALAGYAKRQNSGIGSATISVAGKIIAAPTLQGAKVVTLRIPL